MGAVYLLSETETPHLVPEFDDESYSYQRFGFAMVALDINRDGIDDLVVSAPAYGAAWSDSSLPLRTYYPKSYRGRVYVYYGVQDLGIASLASPDVIID